jgi:hypothetical protein
MDFPDTVRAQAFARDRATCCYSGLNLWIADYGADPAFQIDWAEHRELASRGGSRDIENALCVSHGSNSLRANAKRVPPVLYYAGRPTQEALAFPSRVPDEVFKHLRRMAALRPSDWFLNRALWHVWLGTWWLLAREEGHTRSRDTTYRARVTLGMLVKWRRAAADESASLPELRGLAPERPSLDQKLLWSAQSLSDEPSLVRIMRKLLTHMRANRTVLDRVSDVNDRESARRLLARDARQKLLSPRVRARVTANVRGLQSLIQLP